jgi:hypothetical protein
MRSESFFSVFGLDLDGCEHYPRVNFSNAGTVRHSHTGLQTSDSCNARSLAAEPSGKLEADALTVALLV